MSDERDADETLRERFAALRATDARMAPDFGAMLEQARRQSHDIGQQTDSSQFETTVERARNIREPRRWGRIALFAAGPLLTAAGLAGVLFHSERQADREFDQVVMAWTQTADRALRSPTDGLLALPGDEYLHSVPAVGRGMRNPRSGS